MSSHRRPGDFILDRYLPHATPKSARRLAADRGLHIAACPRQSVQDAFAAIGATTREEVAEAVARFYPTLGLRLPSPRRPWNSEDKRLALFAAAAVVLTHFHNGATALLDDVRNAA